MPTLGKVPRIVLSPIYDVYDTVTPNFRFYFICFKNSRYVWKLEETKDMVD